MKKLKVLKLVDPTPAVEAVMTEDERMSTESLLKRVVYNLGKLKHAIAPGKQYKEYTTFEYEDVDVAVIDRILESNSGLDILAIMKWVYWNDYSTASYLDGVKKRLSPYLGKPKTNRYYRGVGRYTDSQNKFGVDIQKRFLRSNILKLLDRKLKVGDEFEVTESSIISFSSTLINAKEYGGVVFSVKASEIEDRMLHLTKEVEVAMIIKLARNVPNFTPENTLFRTADESIFIPDGKPFTVRVDSV